MNSNCLHSTEWISSIFRCSFPSFRLFDMLLGVPAATVRENDSDNQKRVLISLSVIHFRFSVLSVHISVVPAFWTIVAYCRVLWLREVDGRLDVNGHSGTIRGEEKAPTLFVDRNVRWRTLNNDCNPTGTNSGGPINIFVVTAAVLFRFSLCRVQHSMIREIKETSSQIWWNINCYIVLLWNQFL